MSEYLPEGRLPLENRDKITESILKNCIQQKTILEAQAVKCDGEHNLYVDMGTFTGIIPYREAALGIETGETKDIAVISRVNKRVCFRVTDIIKKDGRIIPLLSRASVQRDCEDYLLNTLSPGDVIPATVTHLEPFGAFVDIGCGIASLIPIDCISVSRISHPKERFFKGQKIYAAVKSVDKESKRICLTHKELLGTWEENAAEFSEGQTVRGIVRTLESYGAFIELAPNLAGLAEAPPNAVSGQTAAVFIKSMVPDRMKIKLNVIDLGEMQKKPTHLKYRITGGHISRWQYSPASSERKIQTVF